MADVEFLSLVLVLLTVLKVSTRVLDSEDAVLTATVAFEVAPSSIGIQAQSTSSWTRPWLVGRASCTAVLEGLLWELGVTFLWPTTSSGDLELLSWILARGLTPLAELAELAWLNCDCRSELWGMVE